MHSGPLGGYDSSEPTKGLQAATRQNHCYSKHGEKRVKCHCIHSKHYITLLNISHVTSHYTSHNIAKWLSRLGKLTESRSFVTDVDITVLG